MFLFYNKINLFILLILIATHIELEEFDGRPRVYLLGFQNSPKTYLSITDDRNITFDLDQSGVLGKNHQLYNTALFSFVRNEGEELYTPNLDQRNALQEPCYGRSVTVNKEGYLYEGEKPTSEEKDLLSILDCRDLSFKSLSYVLKGFPVERFELTKAFEQNIGTITNLTEYLIEVLRIGQQ
ncbi:MAG: hypothetical protein ISS01_02270 [Nanoarchaeota archaeon]|nr:hypothetical protein [Nanoarchaeota archaeon]